MEHFNERFHLGDIGTKLIKINPMPIHVRFAMLRQPTMLINEVYQYLDALLHREGFRHQLLDDIADAQRIVYHLKRAWLFSFCHSLRL